MKIFLLLTSLYLFCSACSYKVYVVRHAEKSAAPASNPLLSETGIQRALALRNTLKSKHIKKIYSTNTARTLTTAAPLSEVINVKTEIYAPNPDTGFINTLKRNATNQLVVGHSNTIDDIANMLSASKVVPGDLPDGAYDNLYVIKLRKNGKGKPVFRQRKYGIRTPVSASAPVMMK